MLEEYFHVAAYFNLGGFFVIGMDGGDSSGSSGFGTHMSELFEMVIWDCFFQSLELLVDADA